MKRVILLLTFLVLISSVTAITDFKYDAVQNNILKDQEAIFLLHITNNDYGDKTYTLESADLNWILEQKTVLIPARATEHIEIRYTPFKDLTEKTYGVHLKITSSTDRIEKYLPVTLLRPDQILDAELITPEYIDYKRPTTIKLVITNKYKIDLKDLDVKLSNSFIDLSEKIDITKEQIRTDEFGLNFDHEIKGGTYPLTVLITSGDKVFLNKDLQISIGINSNLKEINEREESLLIKTDIIKKINEGNSDVQETFIRKLSLSQRLFTRYDPQPDEIISEAEGYVAKWNLKIAPGETLTMRITTDYRSPILLAIIIIGIGYLFYSWQYRSIRVTKKVMTIHSTQDTIGAIKVLINLKNKGGSAIHRVRVVDRIPQLEHNPTHFTGLEPSTINRGNGITLTWEIARLNPGEEKVFSYKIDDKVFIKRRINLPGTYVKYEEGNKILRTKSIGGVLKQL